MITIPMTVFGVKAESDGKHRGVRMRARVNNTLGSDNAVVVFDHY